MGSQKATTDDNDSTTRLRHFVEHLQTVVKVDLSSDSMCSLAVIFSKKKKISRSASSDSRERDGGGTQNTSLYERMRTFFREHFMRDVWMKG